ncbi:pseudouridylate synthase [Pontibacter sp. BT213]|uniref:Pseudouridylate synthase n=1 Tax=Pontibacter fetidus TaxID=2700082 RepID=A0A6B2H0C8_9BACT|nr:pseudouridylate synthase [Pontibacter fetidus]
MPFSEATESYSLPERFTYPFNYTPHPLSLLAATGLQKYLAQLTDLDHNFGLNENQDGKVIGKMFGVLVVKNQQNELGYLAAFSGKLAGSNHHANFVPPVFDGLAEGGFLSEGMQELSRINKEISQLKANNITEDTTKIEQLQELRRTNSIALQGKLFDQYRFVNKAGKEKPLRQLFLQANYSNPPAGAGECAAPKLLQYAFMHRLQPIAMAEFWWGLSPKSATWKHGHYYPACLEKCAPILAHMLEGIVMDERPL